MKSKQSRLKLVRVNKRITQLKVISACLLVMVALGVAADYDYFRTFTLFAAAEAATHEADLISPAPVGSSSQTGTNTPDAPLHWGDGVMQEMEHSPRVTQKAKQRTIRSKPVGAPATQPGKLVNQAWQAYQAGHYDLAQLRYSQVIGGEHNVDVQLGLASIALQQHRRELALAYYQQALMLDPYNVVALSALATWGDVAYADGLEAQIKQALVQQPSTRLQYSLGNLYAGQQRWREAEAAYFASFQADNASADSAYNLAVSLDHLREYKAALTYYLRARNLGFSNEKDRDVSLLNQRIQQLQAAGRTSP